MNKKLLTLFFIIFSLNFFAQNNSEAKIDSLKQILVLPDGKDIDKINSYLELTKIFLHKNLDSAIVYVEKAKILAENNNNIKLIAISLIELARIKEVQNDIEGSITHLNVAEKLYKDQIEDNTFLTVCNYQGMYYDMLTNYDMSIEKYLLGLKLSIALNNREYQAVFLGNLSLVYARANHIEKSLASILEATDLYNKIGTRNQYFQSLIYVGNSYIKLGKYDLAKEYLNKTKVFFTKINDYILLADIYSDLGKISMMTKNENEALEFLLKAQYYALIMKDYNGEQQYKLALINNSLGNIYLYFKNHNQAIKVFKSSEEIGRKIKSIEVLKDSYKGLVYSYLELKKTDSVNHYLSLFIPVNDSLVAEQYNEKIDALNYDYQLEIEKSDFENEMKLINSKNEGQKLFFVSIVSILSLIVLVVFFFFYALKTKYIKSNLLSNNLELEKENLNLVLERKNKELATSVLNLIERNKFISKISVDLEKIKTIVNEESKMGIQNILRDIDRGSTKQLWKEFELRYIEVHKEFFQVLNSKYHNLTSNDRKLCALIKLNLSSKEISSITYQSVQSIKIARYRLRKKLGINKNENLNAFLNAF